jgi:glycosyltransferase involved in cell wall biosynthesis
MRVAVLSSVAWRTPPNHYGPWEQVAYNIAKGVADLGADVTLFATGDSVSPGNLEFIVDRGYEEDKETDAKVAECMHISHLMESAGEYDLIHNNFDFLPLTYSRLIKTPIVTTIHGFSSPMIIPVYKRYNDRVSYVSISNSDRNSELSYIATVYNGLDPSKFTFNNEPEDYLLFFGRIHHDKGTHEAIQIARKSGRRLLIAGIVQDKDYFREKVEPYINGEQIVYLGSAGPEMRDRLLGNACALLHPINFEEPFGLSVAEAMFCGTPVIAYNRGSMPELISGGKTGFLVSSVDEAAEKVASVGGIDRGLCRATADDRFSMKRMASDYMAVYKKVV